MNRRQALKLSALAAGAFALSPGQLLANVANASFTKTQFGNDFLWGVATAAYQIEGAWNVDGKSPNIWDTFTHKKGNIKTGDNGNDACNFYYNYKEDIALLKSLNFKVFRFSLSWSRIMPYGTKHVNQRGIDFYNKVINECLKQGLQPWVTCYHWDLPQILEDQGGWTNRECVNWFAEYVNVCTRAFGDRVKNWMIFNEPLAFTALGYFIGMHAPGRFGIQPFLKATHNVTLCQAEGGRVARANVSGGNIGTTFSASAVDAKNDKKRHISAQQRIDAFLNRLFVEPALGMGYPKDEFGLLNKLEKHMQPGDDEKVKFDFDFLGLQNYFKTVARFSLFPPVMWANQLKAEKLVNGDKNRITEMHWPVTPEGIYEILMQFGKYNKPIIVTENGAAFKDAVKNGRVHDKQRVEFFKAYLSNVLKAKNQGVNIRGYFVWSFLDNFEWAEGYKPRFGIVHNNYITQQRTVKDSGLWWQNFLK